MSITKIRELIVLHVHIIIFIYKNTLIIYLSLIFLKIMVTIDCFFNDGIKNIRRDSDLHLTLS